MNEVGLVPNLFCLVGQVVNRRYPDLVQPVSRVEQRVLPGVKKARYAEPDLRRSVRHAHGNQPGETVRGVGTWQRDSRDGLKNWVWLTRGME